MPSFFLFCSLSLSLFFSRVGVTVSRPFSPWVVRGIWDEEYPTWRIAVGHGLAAHSDVADPALRRAVRLSRQNLLCLTRVVRVVNFGDVRRLGLAAPPRRMHRENLASVPAPAAKARHSNLVTDLGFPVALLCKARPPMCLVVIVSLLRSLTCRHRRTYRAV